MGAKVKIASGTGSTGNTVLYQEKNASGTLGPFAKLSISPGNGTGVLSGAITSLSATASNLTILRDTDYWIKVSWKAEGKVEVYLSTDGISYTKQGESYASISIIPSLWTDDLTTTFMVGNNATSPMSPFNKGIVDLTKSYIKINEVEVWRGAESATYINATYSDFVGSDGTTAGTQGLVPAPGITDNDKFLRGDGIWAAVQTGDSLPSQTGNQGKFLTTDGTDASWANIPNELPTQSGQSGKYLTTNGTAVSWASISIPTVDQTYSGTSTNAQSGVAVKSAIDSAATNYQPKIDASHKVSSDLINDTGATNLFVTSSEKTTWSGKQNALVSGTNI